MGKTYEEIDAKLQNWIGQQKMFFVATAPMSENGLVNCSPKGNDALRVVGPNTLIYLDYSGSGAETIAHIRENARIVIMMCAFEGPPKIFRFHGRGEAIAPDSPEFPNLVQHFDRDLRGVRSIIRVLVERIADSCGYGVPEYHYRQDRRSMQNYIEQHGDAEMAEYRRNNNLKSLDGLPALTEQEAMTLASEVVDRQ